MSCPPFDLRDYFLKELPDPQARLVEAHVRSCSTCREELDRLRLTEAALFALREEEIPQRIGFVSDPVFEPSRWRRAWGAFWGSASRLGFASAAMLSAALVVYSLNRPAPAPAVQTPPAAVALTNSQIEARIQAAVEKAVALSEARQAKSTEKLVTDFLRQERENRRQLAAYDEIIRNLDQRARTLSAAAYRDSGEMQ